MGLYSKTLYPATENDVKDGINPPPVPRHKPFPQTAPIVRTRFVTNHNSVGLARKKAQTISFVEYGFERLGLGHQAVSLSWCSYMVKSFFRRRSLSLGGGLGGSDFWPFFLAPSMDCLLFLLY